MLNGILQFFHRYGQTGSGKTYTMGTAYSSGGSSHGVIPRAMQEIFSRVELGKGKLEFQLRVSFIEVTINFLTLQKLAVFFFDFTFYF